MSLRIGIDVGGTHTDAVILDKTDRMVSAFKATTTSDVTSGIFNALSGVLGSSGVDPNDVSAVMLGTTHCTNAIVERKKLAHVGILRLGKPSTMAIKPFTAFPQDLKNAIGGVWEIVAGGHEYDGREIGPMNEDEVLKAAERFKDSKVEAIAISSVFSPICPDHENKAAELLSREMGNVQLTLSHELGSIGLLERENAAILNACLVKVAEAAINAFGSAMKKAGLNQAKLFLTQNDGTLMSMDYARKYPIRTVASGPTNSIRGAAFLTGINDGIIVDIGGTTTLVGVLARGFPRESAIAVEIGGVRTNFRMPDLLAVGCGGGTVVSSIGPDIRIGPESVGYELETRARAWGGSVLTTTDIAVAAGYAGINDPKCNSQRLKALDHAFVSRAVEKIVGTVEDSVDKMKTNPNPVPVVLVGGGGILIPPQRYDHLKGAAKVVRPEHFQYANAIGAAIAQVSGEVDRLFALESITRADALNQAGEVAKHEAVKAGAKPESVQIVEVDEVPLAYLPGNAIRVRVKAVGSLAM
jgi:N-methylhydantoinase A/oxoprolinase/acetone carboxylase beta subunit